MKDEINKGIANPHTQPPADCKSAGTGQSRLPSLPAFQIIVAMRNLFQYVYYRIAKAYKDIFGIEDAPGYLLIQSCYSWGLLVLVTTLCSYTLALETVVLWYFGIRMKTMHIIITILPFGLLYFFAEHFLGDLKEKYKKKKALSFVCYMVSLSHCK